jgi:hypothetical protein
MILCIEVYPSQSQDDEQHGGGMSDGKIIINSSSQPTFIDKPAVVHFVSLAWATTTAKTSNQDDGMVWSVGRRSGHYHLSSDKSVSREHCRVRIVTTNPSHLLSPSTEEDEEDENNNNGTGINPMLATAVVTSNPIEQQQIQTECHKAMDQLCIVLENVGKLGTYIIEEYEENNTNQVKRAAKKKNDNQDSDSETDDEMDVMVGRSTSQFIPSQPGDGGDKRKLGSDRWGSMKISFYNH